MADPTYNIDGQSVQIFVTKGHPLFEVTVEQLEALPKEITLRTLIVTAGPSRGTAGIWELRTESLDDASKEMRDVRNVVSIATIYLKFNKTTNQAKSERELIASQLAKAEAQNVELTKKLLHQTQQPPKLEAVEYIGNQPIAATVTEQVQQNTYIDGEETPLKKAFDTLGTLAYSKIDTGGNDLVPVAFTFNAFYHTPEGVKKIVLDFEVV